ncbi:flagellar basal body-associated protein FliL [Solimicrobium silvestre]|uniref:Flagellar protein FliL n=1 Tax=Solimicrobium silvestre TaxID=2099400 RepID=A0A2S9GSU4_9BURK|nr:flagellar basal body-associated protein FliL [Solimicrobium silvestre]PRC90783.1 Flagellar basal body-associated protein [Solimicrobium silvestre]
MSKPPPKPEAAAADAVVPETGSKKKKIIIIAVIVAVILASAGGGAMMFLGKKDPNKKDEKKSAEKSTPPVFLALDNFVVNVQSENGDKFLQAGITLQVKNEEQMTYYKGYMPQLRSRILLLLSSKAADELLTNEGKEKLSSDIIKQIQRPYNNEEPTPKEAEERKILGVYFTSFMIQ